MSSFILYQYKNFTLDHTATLLQYDGSVFNIASGDRVQVRIGRNLKAPDLTLDSLAATANGSSVTPTVGSNVVPFRVTEGDSNALQIMSYDCHVVVIDASEASGQRIKHVQAGIFQVQPAPTG